MKTQLLSTLLILFLVNSFCQSQESDVQAKFIVFSDPHYYDPSLGVEGQAFQNYLDYDRKLLRESRELLLQAISICNSSDADFVLIPGDLTKDGSLTSHEEFSKLLQEIKLLGKSVYVVPGNHDIFNGEAKSYKGEDSHRVENISPEKFRSIYTDFAFTQAIYEDKNSLSYVVEPVDGLWLFGLDACMYKENIEDKHPHTDGVFSESTLEWIEELANIGNQNEKKMIAFMHHGVIEHYKGQEKFYGEYIVDDYKSVSQLFASLNINIVFTGHYHAQDITVKYFKDGKYLLDVETGSLVTFPCPIREVVLDNNLLKIHSNFIEKISSHPEGFQEYSKEYVHSGISGIAEKTLISYKLSTKDAGILSGQIADAFVAHYAGDEAPKEDYLDMTGVGIMGRIIILFKKSLIKALYNDLPPTDNNVLIDLNTGKILEMN